MFKKWFSGILVGVFYASSSMTALAAGYGTDCKRIEKMTITNNEIAIEYASGKTLTWDNAVPSNFLAGNFRNLSRHWEDFNSLVEDTGVKIGYSFSFYNSGYMVDLLKPTGGRVQTIVATDGSSYLSGDDPADNIRDDFIHARMKSFEAKLAMQAFFEFLSNYTNMVQGCSDVVELSMR